jgi:hypothetical protein
VYAIKTTQPNNSANSAFGTQSNKFKGFYQSVAAALESTNLATIIQQFDYWLRNENAGYYTQDGHKWIWNGYREWLYQFPWLKTIDAVGRLIRKLEQLGIVISAKVAHLMEIGFVLEPEQPFPYTKSDQRKWYRLDYERLAELTGWRSPNSSQEPKATPEANLHFLHNGSCENSTMHPAKSSDCSTYKTNELSTNAEVNFFENHNVTNDKENNVITSEQVFQDEEVKSHNEVKDSNSDQSSGERKSKRLNSRQSKLSSAFLLDEPIFIQWWTERLLKTKFAQELSLTPKAFVKASIRKNPEQALDMWESFQEEMSQRVHNFQIRAEQGSKITQQEQEQIKAIAPYASPVEKSQTPLLPPGPPPGAENIDCYKPYEPKAIEVSAPPENFFQRTMEMLRANKAKSTSIHTKAKIQFEELRMLNHDLKDPAKRAEVMRKVMASENYTVDFDEEGVPYQVRYI